MILKIRILRCLTRLFMILVSPTMTWYSKELLIFNICVCGFMSSLQKNLERFLIRIVASTQTCLCLFLKLISNLFSELKRCISSGLKTSQTHPFHIQFEAASVKVEQPLHIPFVDSDQSNRLRTLVFNVNQQKNP